MVGPKRRKRVWVITHLTTVLYEGVCCSVGGSDSLFGGSQDGALPLLSKRGGGTVTLSATLS